MEGAAMPGEQLMVIEEPSGEDIAFLAERIYEHNMTQTGLRDGRLFGIFVRGEAGSIVAGLDGWTWGGCLYVDHLWVHEGLRGQGHGSRLLEAAERDAAARGCRYVLLSTYSFQAPDYYRRHGYEVCAVVEDYPPGHAQYYMRKSLAAVP
jgi:ribosomal protein S18 acetylase RimI-like enzyme